MEPSLDLAKIALTSSQLISISIDYIINIFAGIGTIFIGFWISGKSSKLAKNLMSKVPNSDATLIPVIAAVLRYAGLTLTLIIALSQFGIETTSIIAVLGAAGLAIGLALQGTLSNVAAGVMLLILRPFETGDWIETNGISGTVKEIGLFTTHIDTFDNVYISIPNSSIWSSIIINHAKHGTRRLDFDIGVSYNTNLDIAEKALMTLTNDTRVLKKPKPIFLVVSYDDSAIVVRLRLYAKYNEFYSVSCDIRRQIKSVFEDHNIEIPYPQKVVHLINEKK